VETINGFLFVVCDGIGGHAGGETASSIAVNNMVYFFTKEKYTDLRYALTDAIIFTNQQILNAAADNQDLKGMGTTICVLLIREEQVWFAHVGDSRIYLFNHQQKQLHRLTKDHSIVQTLLDKGEITDAEAETHPQRNRILRALGVKSEIHPTVCNMPLLPANGDTVLLCTDGLTCMVCDEVLEHILQQNIPLQEKGNQMILTANQAGGVDNITLQLVKMSNSPHKQSVFESKNAVHPETIINETNENEPREKKKRKNLRKIILIILGIVLLAGGAFFIINNVLNK
jgi:serine/threonine protein phosphatase PrpC